MRKFLVILLCFSFIVTPVSSIGAEEKKSGGQMSMAGYMNQILGIGTAVVGTGILIACPLKTSPSIYIFFAGSLIYVASEIMGGKAQQAFLKANTEEIDQLVNSQKEGGGDAQKAIIETKLKEEEDKLAFVNKRKTWMMAITAVYLAATAAAIIENINYSEYATPICPGSGGALAKQTASAAAIGGAYSLAVGYGSGSMISALIAGIMGAVMTWKGIELKMGKPTVRAIAFGVASALSATITMMLSSEAKKIQENIAKLKELAAKFKTDTATDGGLEETTTETAGAAAGVSGGALPNGVGLNTTANIKPLASGSLASRNCWANTANGLVFSESACKNPLKVSRPKLGANLNLPTLKSVTESGADLAQAISDGDTSRADVIAGELAANASRMKDVKDSLLNQLNNKLKAQGKKPLELDKEINRRISQLEAGVNQNLASKGFGPMASIGGASLEEMKKELPAKPIDVRARDAIAIQPSNTSSTEDENSLSEEGSEAPESGDEASEPSESLDDFETNESDISDRAGDSIFNLISTRYLLNYHRFFKPKEEEEEKVPAKKP